MNSFILPLPCDLLISVPLPDNQVDELERIAID